MEHPDHSARRGVFTSGARWVVAGLAILLVLGTVGYVSSPTFRSEVRLSTERSSQPVLELAADGDYRLGKCDLEMLRRGVTFTLRTTGRRATAVEVAVSATGANAPADLAWHKIDVQPGVTTRGQQQVQGRLRRPVTVQVIVRNRSERLIFHCGKDRA
jgi:hypothetical protein